jgi:hypothetical protein
MARASKRTIVEWRPTRLLRGWWLMARMNRRAPDVADCRGSCVTF